LRQALDDQLVQPGSVYQQLAQLDLPLWVSGAYDGLLGKALKANSIVLGSDTQYWKPDRPTVVRLAGDLASLRGEVVIESDYEVLRQNEGERKLLISFLRQELKGKVALFLGFDPASPDFALLVQHILNHHLAGVETIAFLVWPSRTAGHTWSSQRLYPLEEETMQLLAEIVQLGGLPPG
jgi:hypothetical protein